MNPWFSVWGLAADMVGVIIITYDIWPEYKLHRLREAIEWEYKALASSIAETRREDDVGQTVQAMLHNMNRGRIDHFRSKLKLPPICDGRRLPTEQEIDISKHQTDTAIKQKISTIERRARPPVGFGLFLVILGFVLQLVGALPPAFVQRMIGQ